MDEPVMAREAISSLFYHERVLHRCGMAPQAVALCDSPGFGRNADEGGVCPQGFMVEVVQSGFGFIGELYRDVAVGKVAFDAGELLVLGLLPRGGHVLHAVAGHAEDRTPGGVVTRDGSQGDQDAHERSHKEDANGQLRRLVFTAHVSYPLFSQLVAGENRLFV